MDVCLQTHPLIHAFEVFFVFFEKLKLKRSPVMRDWDLDWDERRDSGEGRRMRWAKSAEIH